MKSKNILLYLFGLCSLVLLSACGTSKTAQNSIPQWALNPNTYPQAQTYLMAVGTGSTLDEASKDAFSGLSQRFRMTVEGSEELISEVNESYTDNQFFTSGTTQLLNNIKVGTNQELINTTILEAQIGPDGLYYALAGMDRMETAHIYNQEITSNILRLEELEKLADEEPNTLQKLMLLKNTRMLAIANQNLSKQHNILMSGASDLNLSAKRLSRIEDKFRKTQQKSTFNISSDNATSTISAAIAEVFHKEGFSSTEDKDTAILTVEVNYQTQEAEMKRENTEFVKWELTIEVKDNEAERTFRTYIIEGRDGALSYQDALKRADFSVRKKIDTDFRKFINQQLLESN